MHWIQLIYGASPGFIWTMIKHPVTYIKLNREAATKSREIATLAIPSYEIPTYLQGMPYCRSRQKYLRPTFLCQSNAPEIIAMANRLGAFQKPPWQYAESCFDFVKRNIQLTLLQPMHGAVKTLHMGRGICLDKVGLFVALCRAGGIPSRYKSYNHTLTSPAYDVYTSNNPITREVYNSLGYVVMHGAGEILIEGKWLPCEITNNPELEAGLGMPLLGLGDNDTGFWNYQLPGATIQFESILPGLFIAIAISMKLDPGMFLSIELCFRDLAKQGKQILTELGEQEYTRRAKQSHKAILPEVSRRLFLALEKAGEV